MAASIEPPSNAQVAAAHMVARNDVAHLAALVELVDAGLVALDVSGKRPPAERADIHRLSEAGQTPGKIITIP